MIISIDEFISEHQDKISYTLMDKIVDDYRLLRKHYSLFQANDMMGKRILENKYGTVVEMSLAKRFKKWCINKIEESYDGNISLG